MADVSWENYCSVGVCDSARVRVSVHDVTWKNESISFSSHTSFSSTPAAEKGRVVCLMPSKAIVWPMIEERRTRERL